MRSRLSHVLLCCALTVLAFAQAAHAVPVNYTFTTASASQVSSHPDLRASFLGQSAAGSFSYDPAGTLFGTVATGQFAASSIYVGPTFTDLQVTVGVRALADAGGGAVVGDDRFVAGPPGLPLLDILVLFADPTLGTFPPSAYDLTRFDVVGHTLVNVRLFWIEALIDSAPDFLLDQQLPAALPTFKGRLALDFVPTSNPVAAATKVVFFDDLVAVPQLGVPTPATLPLLALALLACRRGGRSSRSAPASRVAEG